MVQFNGSVKVLGYYLSDEERSLKRKWSAENHERMVEVKKQIRSNKLQQYRQKRHALFNGGGPAVAPEPSKAAKVAAESKYAPLPKGPMAIQLQQMLGSKMGESPLGYPTTVKPQPQEVVHSPASPVKAQQNVERMSRERTSSMDRSVDDAVECKIECERVTGKVAEYLFDVSQSLLERVHGMASSVVDKDDAPALTALRNLIIPPLQ